MTSVAEAPRLKAWLAFRQSVVHFDSSKMNPWIGLRNALGVALPLFAGMALHSMAVGVGAALGALNVAFRDSDAPYRQRARHMLLCSVLMGIAAFAGSVSGQYPVFSVIVAACWALVAGMLIALSVSASELGVLSLVLLLIYSAVPQDPAHAALSGIYAFAGGLLQTLLSLALWPLHRYRPERRALADLYRELARAAVSPPHQADDAPAATAESIQAQIALATLDHDRSIESERFRFLLSQAERIRLALLALRRLRARLLRGSPAGSEGEILDAFLKVCSQMLASVAAALEAGNAALPAQAGQLEALVEGLEAANASASETAVTTLFLDLRFQMEALAGQLRAAQDLALSSTPSGSAAFERVEASKPWRLRLNGTLATLRANLNLQSAAYRHAIRLAVCIAMGDALAHGFSLRRPYWLPMTVAMVLRSDFASTFSRGALRLLGTFAGLIFATLLFHALPAFALAPVLTIAVLTFFIRWAGSAHYGVAVTGITAVVVLLLSLAGAVPREVMAARLLNTSSGGVIALLAYWLWPTWERHQVAEALAGMLDAIRVYFQAVRDALLTVPSKIDRDRARVAARLERSNLEASIERASAEPGVSADRLMLLGAMLASTRRLARSLLALEAAIGPGTTSLSPAFRTFAHHIDLTLYYLAAVLRGSSISPELLPDLRGDHRALLDPTEQSGQPCALVNAEADRLTNAVNTLSEEVFRWSVPQGPA